MENHLNHIGTVDRVPRVSVPSPQSFARCPRRTEIEQWCRQWSEDTEVVAVEFIEYAREGAPLPPAISEEMAAQTSL
jgi:hypothetical protein